MTRYWIALAAATALSTGLAACGEASVETGGVETVEVDTSADMDMADADKADAEMPEKMADALSADGYCTAMGPQTPRDITSVRGTNPDMFEMAMAPQDLNLCNIHTHTNAEHKGPGFSVKVNNSAYGDDYNGYACDMADDLTEAELAPYADMDYGKVAPGDTIEVHWVHSSCPVQPGETLGACLSDGCDNPLLRVETQVFTVVNDRSALDFMDMVDSSNSTGVYQASMIPSNTGDPVVFRGSTTGPSYDAQGVCSPLKVTWSVRPQCAKLDIASLDAWAEEGNVYSEDHSHGVRELVTDPRLLSSIDN